jgi:O-antigen ligase
MAVACRHIRSHFDGSSGYIELRAHWHSPNCREGTELNVQLEIRQTSDNKSDAHSRSKFWEYLNHKVTIDWVVFWAFVAGLAWCPFYFGGNDLLAWGINAVFFPTLLIIYEVSLLVRGARHPVSIGVIWIPALLFGAVLSWTFVQNASWTPEGWHHPIWDMASDALERPLEGSISVNRDLTSLAQLRLITSASSFWLAVQLCRDGRRADFFLKSIGLIACAYAIYGLAAAALMPGIILWVNDNLMVGFVRSTFVNKNSFATYDGIGFLAVCGLLFRVFRRRVTSVGGSVGFTIATLIETLGRSGAVLLGAAFILLTALLLTGSRGGILATSLGVFVLAALMFTRRSSRPTRQLETIILCGALFAAVVTAFGDTFFGRIEATGIYDDTRMAVNRLTLGAVRDAPLLGFGYGTFADVFPMYRDRSVGVVGIFDEAHNSYLEVLLGLGLAFGSMLIVTIAMLVFRCLRGAVTRRQNATIPGVAASVGFLVGLHSLVDFSLQMQAVTLTFMAILGAGIAQSESSRRLIGD